MSWSRTFDEPIALPNGGQLRTLRDAGHYIAALPKAQHDKTHWQTEMHELMTPAERGVCGNRDAPSARTRSAEANTAATKEGR